MLSIAGDVLHEDDVRSTSMGAQGEDIQLSTAARKVFPYCFECKNKERLNLWEAWKQTEYHAEKLKVNGCTIIARNRQKPLAVLDAKVFLDMCYTLYKLGKVGRELT